MEVGETLSCGFGVGREVGVDEVDDEFGGVGVERNLVCYVNSFTSSCFVMVVLTSYPSPAK